MKNNTKDIQLTIGMATFNDTYGVWMTVQALRIYHDLTDCELVVVDNNPSDKESEHLRGFLNGINTEALPTRYIPFQSPVGTSAPRNQVFEQAVGKYVLCVDSHVMLLPGAISKLKTYYAEHPDTDNLLHGPIVFDKLDVISTHFDDLWRAEMWGTWSQAWECKCRKVSTGNNEQTALRFSVLQNPTNKNKCHFILLQPGQEPATACPACQQTLPDLGFWGHEAELRRLGYYPLGYNKDDQPFEIPGQGLGIFSARKETWHNTGGFNPHFTGFGGEEMYIHEKFRQHGYKTLCLPFLSYNHCFYKPPASKYPVPRFKKIRNYVLGALELGNSDIITKTEEHFIKTGLAYREQWDQLLSNPVGDEAEECKTCKENPSGRPLPHPSIRQDLQAIAAWCKEIPRDSEKHIPKLTELASQCKLVVEFADRRESTVGLLAGVVKSGGSMISYNTEHDKLFDLLHAAYPKFIHHRLDSTDVKIIELPDDIQGHTPDLIFIDTQHTFERVSFELEEFGIRSERYIVLHDTISFGKRGYPCPDKDGKTQACLGLWDAMKQFISRHSEWFVAWHTNEQHGLTVLSKLESDKPEKPIRIWPLDYGPGTELKALLKGFGILEKENCDCNKRMHEMDELGVDGCREKFDIIVGWLREGKDRWGWQEMFDKSSKALVDGLVDSLFSGLAFKINPLDPIPGLVTESIRRASVLKSFQ